jgi:Flp pilus assembly CpaE family ATPase
LSQQVKILLVEDNRLEARQTQQWLANAKDGGYEVETVERMSVALERLSRGGIDLVLLDLNLPDSRGLETFLTLHGRAPQFPIVVLTGEDNESLGTAAVEKGAQDYLVKNQVDGAKLARVLRFALVRQRAQGGAVNEPKNGKAARVIGVLGAKGGVGTTTVALNVALALAKQQKAVILAEFRPSFGTLAYRLRQQPAKSLRTLLDHFPERNGEHDLQAILCKGPAESRILFGPQAEDVFKEIDPGQGEAVVKGLAAMAEFVILDLPNQPSAATQTAVRLCHCVAVVTDREVGSVVCAKVALNQLQSWGVGGNLVGTVIVSRMENLSPMKPMEIRTRLGCEIVGVIPPGTSACFEALEAGAVSRQNMGDHVGASFVEIANRLSADHVVGMRF